MIQNRREFLAGAGMAMATGTNARAFASNGAGAQKAAAPEEIVGLFHSLPGDVAIKIRAPAANGKPEYLVESEPAKKMFVGSAIKTFVLCETLRQADSPTVVQTLQNVQLDLNASVWSPDSATFNPPSLIGRYR
jgi:beta-lactamase class A